MLVSSPALHLVDWTIACGHAMAGVLHVVTAVRCVPAFTVGMGHTGRFGHGPGRAEAVGQNQPKAILIPFQFHYSF
jgi:hypothetical protein